MRDLLKTFFLLVISNLLASAEFKFDQIGEAQKDPWSLAFINQDQFLEEVVEKSKTTPVLVDFWAPWCGPCKQLTPVLEKLVNSKNGKIILAKVNVDENQSIAAQLKIQSIISLSIFSINAHRNNYKVFNTVFFTLDNMIEYSSYIIE